MLKCNLKIIKRNYYLNKIRGKDLSLSRGVID